jgi:hypothetical protein
MSSERADEDVSPTSAAWRRYYEEASRRRRERGGPEPKRLHEQRKRRRQLERVGIVISIAGLALLAWIFDVILARR